MEVYEGVLSKIYHRSDFVSLFVLFSVELQQFLWCPNSWVSLIISPLSSPKISKRKEEQPHQRSQASCQFWIS
ncbi:hypothetical protein DNTS_030559, partial [Danionella cerebrum]